MTYYVYIMTNRPCGTLYVGVAGDLNRRAREHREGLIPGFTSRDGLKQLVWYEPFDWIHDAIHREKRLKHWNRAWKVALVEKTNPMEDLFPTLM